MDEIAFTQSGEQNISSQENDRKAINTSNFLNKADLSPGLSSTIEFRSQESGVRMIIK